MSTFRKRDKNDTLWYKEEKFCKSYSRFYPYIERSTPYRHLVNMTLKLATHPQPKSVCDLGYGSGILLLGFIHKYPCISQAIGIDYLENF